MIKHKASGKTSLVLRDAAANSGMGGVCSGMLGWHSMRTTHELLQPAC